jgi:hypothetical protein
MFAYFCGCGLLLYHGDEIGMANIEFDDTRIIGDIEALICVII